MEMFQLDFIQRALVAGMAIAVITPILGLLLILRRQSLMADTLAHVSLAGVSLGMLWQLNPTWTTLVVVVLVAILIEYLRGIYANYSEVSIAVTMSGGMALAFVLMSFADNATTFKIDQFLFGSIILITKGEVVVLIGLAVVILILYLIFRKPLYVFTFDEATAHTVGLPVRLMSTIFSVTTGVVISVMLPIVGALLVAAFLVVPSATSILISKSYSQSIVIGFFINFVGIILGIMASYHLDTPPGASITLAFIIIFLLVSLGNQWFKR